MRELLTVGVRFIFTINFKSVTLSHSAFICVTYGVIIVVFIQKGAFREAN